MKRLVLTLSAVASLAATGIARADIVHNDDVIIIGSLCVGFDCVNGENFGFDTQRLKENNLRIHFDDTSNSASFPRRDWRIVINDSTNGGGEYFAIEDSTAGRQVFRIEAGARTNALYVEADGDIGVGTNNPAVDVDVKTGNTPTYRLQQDGTAGFTPQTWDVAGNEAGFFIRDATNGSTLPLRIRPGAPSSAVDIHADGDVGVGTSSPQTLFDGTQASLHVRRTDGDASILVEEANGTPVDRALLELKNNGGTQFLLNNTNSGDNWQFSNDVNGNFIISLIGSGGRELQLTNTGFFRVGPAGATTFEVDPVTPRIRFNGSDIHTVPSSRKLKEDIAGVDPAEILAKVMQLPIAKWSYKADEGTIRHIGPLAEDFHELFAFEGPANGISLIDVDGINLAAIQGLHQKLAKLEAERGVLQSQVAQLQAQLDAVKQRL